PLRERPEDILLLAQLFLNRYTVKRDLQLSSAAIEGLQSYPWPGNVRELENLMQRLAILARKEMIDKEDLPMRIQIGNKNHKSLPFVVHMPQAGFPLKDIERQAISQALVASSGNLTKAAKFLHIPRHILAYRIKKYEIDDSESISASSTNL
ncbi:MAG: helix-turn-helix domain-containing protein, partial [Desulfuromonadales bacterium]|nr:helix-turn-helix domain-containing protein [Desulfuromonadales bacterium]